MGGHLRSQEPDVLLESCDDREEAGEWMLTWAALLVKMRIQDSHGVYVRLIQGTWAWGIYLHEHAPGKRTIRLAQLEASLTARSA